MKPDHFKLGKILILPKGVRAHRTDPAETSVILRTSHPNKHFNHCERVEDLFNGDGMRWFNVQTYLSPQQWPKLMKDRQVKYESSKQKGDYEVVMSFDDLMALHLTL